MSDGRASDFEQTVEKGTCDPAPAAVSAAPGDLTALAAYALRYVKPGWTLGLGTGRAASAFIRSLAATRMKVRGVPTSSTSEALARELGLEIVSLAEVGHLDLAIDGADEVDPTLNLIKGHGGALVREKVVAGAARRLVILVGVEKMVRRLGEHGHLPVEVVPFAAAFCTHRIAALGLRPKLRVNADGANFVSDNGNVILDCVLAKPIERPSRLEQQLISIPGVVGTGIFVGLADTVVVAAADGSIRVLRRRGGG